MKTLYEKGNNYLLEMIKTEKENKTNSNSILMKKYYNSRINIIKKFTLLVDNYDILELRYKERYITFIFNESDLKIIDAVLNTIHTLKFNPNK